MKFADGRCGHRLTILAELRRHQSSPDFRLQILLDRRVADGHVDQRAVLQPRDDRVVFDRIDGDAAVAAPQHAAVLGAIAGRRVPVRVDDPFERRRVIDVAVVGRDALKLGDDHVAIHGAVVAIDDGLVVIHHFGARGLERAERHHVEVFLEALELDRLGVRPVGSAVRRIMRRGLSRFEVQKIKSLVRRRLRNVEHREHVFLRKGRLMRDRNGARHRGHRRVQRLGLLQDRIAVRTAVTRRLLCERSARPSRQRAA